MSGPHTHSFSYMVTFMTLSVDGLERLFKPLLDSERVKLCGVKVSGRSGRPLIQLFVDWDDGNITVGACADISRQAQDLLDMQEWAPQDYRLMVSSPGIDWPLREIWQFRKNVGRVIRRGGDEESFEGRLIGVSDEGKVRLELPEGIVERTVVQLTGARVIIEQFGKGSADFSRRHLKGLKRNKG